MPEGQKFSRLGKSHASAVHELEKLCFEDAWSKEQCARAFENSAYMAWGLWREGLQAYLAVFAAGNEMEIINFAARPQCRRQGFGKTLLAKVLQEACKMGIQSIWLDVRESNQAAISLYEHSGFRACGIRKNYYPDTRENALVYVWKNPGAD